MVGCCVGVLLFTSFAFQDTGTCPYENFPLSIMPNTAFPNLCGTMHLGLYTIVITDMVWSMALKGGWGGSVGGRIVRNGRAIVLQ